jgi:hypothetical protein
MGVPSRTRVSPPDVPSQIEPSCDSWMANTNGPAMPSAVSQLLIESPTMRATPAFVPAHTAPRRSMTSART